ncbi:MAG: aminotransferase class I/II-fold pyridoxal phosphate-dependent enzyme [Chitinivibrionales bacterium]|nr:aminotransferase class I/II-fold pyridoxal phosphate-dependent enzyme [Chitinivibrionales bacterium]
MIDGVQAHGSMPFNELRELNIDPASVLDFSATVNPFPLPENVKNLISPQEISSYPDIDCYEATKSLADFHGIHVRHIALTAGMTEAIFALPRLFNTAAQFGPTYGDYAEAYRRNNQYMESLLFPEASGMPDTLQWLQHRSLDVVIVCNPNNPNGRYLSPDSIQQLCEVVPQTTVCIDESYQELGEDCETALPLLSHCGNLLILKSLTKPFGIGGLRAAYAVSSEETIQKLSNFLLPWGVSSIAQRIVPSLINNHQCFQRQWTDIIARKQDLMQALSNDRFIVSSGRCPFFLVKTGNAEHTRQRLLKEHHIAIRSCASFGMPEWIRIMPGREEQSRYLLEGLKNEKCNFS